MVRPINPFSNQQKAKEAAAKGLKHFNGTPCIQCGGTLRYVINNCDCVRCKRAKSAQYRKDYPNYHYNYYRL